MASIPLPALDIKPPQQADPLASFQKLMALRSLTQEQQIQQQNLTEGQQKIQDQQATTAAMKDWDGKDYDALTKSVLQHGGSATAATSIQQHGLTIKKTVSDIAAADAKTGSTNLETFIGKHKAIGDALEGIENVPDDQLQTTAAQKVAELTKAGVMDPPTAQQAMQAIQNTADPKALRALIDQTAKSSMGMKAAAEQAKTEAETAKDKAQAGEASATADQKRNESAWYARNPSAGAPGVPAETVSLTDYMRTPQRPGEATHTPANFPAWKAAQEAQATLPLKVALAQRTKQAEQVITQGDPEAAGKLLADGSLTLSELKSRGTTPQFIVQATNAAQKANPGFNPQKAEADLSVAKSPANLAFFGSAKSLIDPGGTLDQLKAAAKDSPDGKIPIFNSVADAMRASTGSGPIAKYASLALGVADDYSKVMGGGQGSDTSRTQALSLIAAKQSPEQRDASLEGIRGAVTSQTNSRIGGNAVMQRMYGGSVNSSPKTAAQTKTYQGHTYVQQPDGSYKLKQ